MIPLTILLVLNLFSTYQCLFTPKTIISLKKLTHCDEYPNSKMTIKWFGKIDDYNKTQKSINGYIMFPKPVDEYYETHTELMKWSNKEWKQDSIKLEKVALCQPTNNQIRKQLNILRMAFRMPSNCPIPPGTYTVRNGTVQSSDTIIPIMKGHYKVIINLIRKDVIMSCSVGFVDVAYDIQ